MIAPESDVRIFFFELPLTKNIEETIENAWKHIHSFFDLNARYSYPAVTDDWEKIYQVVYDVPVSESRTVTATARVFKNQLYLCLIEGDNAGVSRRGAELNIMSESWKPVGFKETQLNDNEAKVWTEADAHSFENFISDGMKKLNIPGAAVAIIQKNGDFIYKKGFGVTQLGSNDSVTINTPFMIGSITKSLTTLLMGMLIDQKKLSWKTPVTSILSNFSLADADLTQRLTIRDTVGAASGMPRGGLEAMFKYNGITPEDRLLEMKKMKPTTKMGETYQYSDYLVMAGGYAATRACMPDTDLENAYALAMQKFIFDPLKMHNTRIKFSDALQFNPALPHAINFKGKPFKVSVDVEKFAYSLAPAGAVWSTIMDMSHYLLLEMNKGVFDGKRLISEAQILERRKPGIRMNNKSYYGLCLKLTQEHGLNMAGHDGGTMGFSSDLFFLPEKGIGVVILTNSALLSPFLKAVREKFLELTFSAPLRSKKMMDALLLDRKTIFANNQKSPVLNPLKIAWIKNMVGEFTNDHLGLAKIIQSGNGRRYEIQFQEWTVQIGGGIESSGEKILVPIDTPSHCVFKLLVKDNGNTLVLKFEQEQYDFVRKIS